MNKEVRVKVGRNQEVKEFFPGFLRQGGSSCFISGNKDGRAGLRLAGSDPELGTPWRSFLAITWKTIE
jgi:hypothetical protein